jgi:hypothetical protein
VLAASDNPTGKLPALTLHVYGFVPFTAASVDEYAEPTSPFGKLVVVIRTVPDAFTTMLRLAVAVRLALSVTITVKLDVPATVGVPEITPVAPASDSPVGKLPELKLHE